MRGPLFSLEPEAVDATANSLAKRAMKLQGFFESQNLQAPVFVAKKIKKEADTFKQYLPLIHALCNPGLRPRHWEEISEVVHFAMERDSAFTLSRVVDMDVATHLTALQEISDSASREYGLEKTLESIYEQWQPVNFELKAWKDTETYIVAGSTVDEMQSLMDDHIIKVQTMKGPEGSPYAKAFMEKITSLESWLLQTQEIMDIWMKVQGVWLYLEPIFSSEDIVKQMPTEATIFKQVDMDWRATMAAALERGDAKKGGTIAGSWTEVLATNAAEMLKSSDDPQALCETLATMVKNGGKQQKEATRVLHIGWREAMNNKTNSWINMGVVAALVFSVLFSAINQPFGVIEANDMWQTHREAMNNVLVCLLYISTIFGLITVVLTILLLIHMAAYVNDADDFLFFMNLNPTHLVDLCIVVCLLCGGVSIPLAAVVGNKEPIGSICFFTGILTFTGVLYIYLRSLIVNNQRVAKRQKETEEHQETIARILREELEKIARCVQKLPSFVACAEETKDPTRVNPHMKKVKNPVDPHAARGNVELWLVEVEAAMLETIRHVCLASAKDYEERNKFTDWLKQWPGQAVIAIFCLFWTRETPEGGFQHLFNQVLQVADKLKLTLADIIDLVRNDIPPLTRCTLEALIVIFVHNKDTVEELGALGTSVVDDFDWLVQLRYYVEDGVEISDQGFQASCDDLMFVRITNSFLGYAYEYLGNSSRLIVTPLTDRCYRTCCGALHLLYGAAPEGPAGTGKTETVKDLAKALARFCVVFNCSDELDYLAMAKFFKGLAASGGWACFDEFNRIDAEVLSVIAQQILCIQNAIREKKTHFEFEGTELPIIWTCFITMNPGYAGRAELPDNLKALFRTVAMMVQSSVVLPRPVAVAVTTYKLCSEQLSSQKHYDYGMRAVFAVLVQAGRLKRNNPTQEELAKLMLQSVNDVNLAKFLDFDVPLYNGITKDLFPGVELPQPDYSMMVLNLAYLSQPVRAGAHPYFIDKIIQFYECHLVRHSVMLVGMPFSGKTTALNTLQKALTDLAQEGSMHAGCIVHQARLNPKSIPARDLYGCFEEVSREWVDGIVAVLFREFARNQTEERKWLVFDGPVDAVWIENMNTVMDENKKLCLNSGEIIAMSANMRTIIEPMDVEVASPATISRNGMVFFEPHLMGYQHLIDKTLKGGLPKEMEEAERSAIASMIDFLVSPVQEQNLVQSFLQLLTTKLQTGYKDGIFVIQPNLPDRGSVFDYVVDLKQPGWTTWMDTVEAQSIPNSAQVQNIIVQTVDNAAISECIEHRMKLLFCGPTGTGKTVYMQQALMAMPKETHMSIQIGFSAQTKCSQTQDLVDAKLERRRKGVYGPPMGRTCVVMVDDLNMPVKEKYGAMPPIEILRQSMDSTAYGPTGGWFDRKDATHPFRSIIDVVYFAAMGPPGGGRNFITPRILGHMYLVGFPLLDDDNMMQIFNTVLEWKFRAENYPAEVASLSKKMVQATLEIYKNTSNELRPTPMKVHYTFNLRDFSKVICGVLLLKKNECDGASRHVRLWAHEILRVFGDRLIDDHDREWMMHQLREQTKKNFQVSFDEIMIHLDTNKDGKVNTLDEVRTLFFGDMLSPASIPQRPYTECGWTQPYGQEIEAHLVSYNEMSSKPMDLVCFLYMLEHLARVARVIKSPGGNALLVGLGGSGRQSCTRLACYMADFAVFQIEIAKGYDMSAFREDMKKMLTKAGGSEERTIFLFSDTQIKDEGFVEDVNNLLNTGEIPNLFPAEEADAERVAVCEMVRKAAVDEGKAPDGTLTQLFAFFIERCRAMVGCVVCFSPIGDNWRTRLRQFPSLVNCCTIDWYTAWPPDALMAVATKFLEAIPDLDNEVRQNCVEMCQYFHLSSKKLAVRFEDELKRIYYSTPTSFLELIQTFKSLLGEKRDSISSLKSKYEVGLEKLTTTEQSVEGMKQELIALQPKLVEKNKEVGEMMIVVNEESAKTEKVKEVVAADEAVASKAAAEADGIKKECEEALAEAMPALNEALKALDTLSSKEIAEVKAMKNPAAPVRLVLSAVCVLRNVKPVRVKDESGKMVDDFWPAAVKMISDMGFLQSLQTFDKDNIPPATIKKIAEYTVKEDFQPDRVTASGFARICQWNICFAEVQKSSTAAWGLCMWVRAMETYDRVAKVVAPKKDSLAEAEAAYQGVMGKLQEKRAELQKVMDELTALNEKLSSLRQEQDNLTNEVDLCQKKLERAETLITSLGGEKTRWTQNAIDLAVRSPSVNRPFVEVKNGEDTGPRMTSADYVNLTGDVIVASGLIAYLGAFTPDFRESAVREWAGESRERAIPGSEKFSLEHCLGEPVKVRAWVVAGLPNDSFSIENGIIMDKARRWECSDVLFLQSRSLAQLESGWPLCIDPQGQANRWIKKMGQPLQLVVAKFTDGDYLKRLEGDGSGRGTSAAPADLQEGKCAPTLAEGDGRMGRRLAGVEARAVPVESTIEWSKSFKFYLTTKLRNPHYLPEVAVKVTLLNFMITQVGLQDQLLNIVVEKERPDLAEEKARLVVEGAENKEQLELTENKILDVLSSSQGNILEDEAAVQVLSASKQLSNEIAQKQQTAETTERQIDEARLQYVPVAFQTAILFFCIADLANIDPMYQYSLPFFINLFRAAISKSEKTDDIAGDMLYKNICRSLFEKHKLLFSFLLTMRLRITTGKVSMSDYRFLLTGGTAMEEPPAKPDDWIPDRCWLEIFKLSKLDEIYTPLPEMGCLENLRNAPEGVKGLTQFQKLLVLRCVRPDRVLPAVLTYVTAEIGEKFVTPPPFDIAGSYADSSNTSPLIFILSPGSDPSSALYMFATDKGREINSLSLGQGQGPKAERLLSDATESGSWVLLQNCHLFASWMPKLDKILEQMDPKQTNSDFRLWLTSYPSDKFPVSILQNSVKITNEAPQGLRMNLVGSYLMDPISNEEFFEGCKNPQAFKRLLFALCFFHAVIQERRLFGPLGWNIPYEFTQNDLRISARQLQMFIDESPEQIQFKAINYLAGECNYGGRVTEAQDRRLLMTLLLDYYNPEVLKPGHSLCVEHPEFTVPPAASLEDTLEMIRQTPIVTPPGIYGFHTNANLTREQNETYAMMENLLLTVGQASGSGGTSPEETVGEAATDILRRMPEQFDLVEVQKRYPTMYEESMNTVLVQELTRFNSLTRVIGATLKDIQKAIQGLLLMSPDLEQVFLSIFNGKTPALWLANSYPSLKPLGGYTNDLIERLKFFQAWIDHGIPVTFWLSGIYFTQAFTTGAAQNFARKWAIPIDTLVFDFDMPPDQQPSKKPENGVYCYGLFLEGCKWDWAQSGYPGQGIAPAERNYFEVTVSSPNIFFEIISIKYYLERHVGGGSK
ncbi:Dynein axonemal heavy chain 1 (Axonemal beta dynein heavy chain 1) (Ciliary dynein heavy chain 1) (Heat shock regulated protein 1) (HSRF-1) (hDHC7) [Durusdinium trenchii]|uniref:Dynein axonemal heavy chain 1 (Axonemal beta dynein heavy chain 1) (Ciliary dynein heavy chain 1) (Heat shock regulated protein 1) (HSRF-1) (HDHC7) n=1 Tax=Durusdinium trenchii TaxID=1381693 RepID=A0ABP0SJQ9_9DINO